ncbi:MAG TPA: addiction module protein [Longimicrobium sp.]|jgi:putative addiction module component (TIGR02574 family)
MSTTIDEVESIALQLPRAERARLAERLIASLDEDLAVEDRWKEEVRRRVEELRAGAVPSILGDQVFREIEEMLR